MASDLIVKRVRPHAGQQQVIDGAGRYNVMMCGRRFGKSTFIASRLMETALEGYPAGYWTPEHKDAAEVWDELKRRLHAVIASANETTRRMKLITGGGIEFWPLDKKDAGRSRKYKRIALDEASKAKQDLLEYQWDQVIRPTLADMRGDAYISGTPQGQNTFWRMFRRSFDADQHAVGWRSFQLPTSVNPTIPREELAEIEADLRRRGKTWIWEQEWLAIPSDSGVNPFGLAKLRAAEQPAPTGRPVVCWGVDLAKKTDFTVLVGLDADGGVAAFHRWTGVDWTEQERQIAEIVKASGRPIVSVDASGVGDPVADRLERLGLWLDRFVFTSTSRQALLEEYDRGISDGAVRVLAGRHMDEMMRMEYRQSSSGATTYVMPGKGAGEHDDCVMAGALAWRAYRLAGYPRIERVRDPWARRGGGLVDPVRRW